MPRKIIQISPSQVAQYAALGLTTKEICDCLGISPETFYKRAKRNPAIMDAVEQGKSKMIAQTANVIKDHALGKPKIDPANGQPMKDAAGRIIFEREPDPQWAWRYLQKHAGNYKDQPVAIETSGSMTVNANVAVEALGPEACERMARAYLQTRGKL